jgi:outer membrane protein
MLPQFLARPLLAAAVSCVLAPEALAGDGSSGSWFSGDWYLKVGGAGFSAPKFDGDDSYEFAFSPIVSLGKSGNEARYSSRNDNISLGLIDTGAIRAGLRR